MTTVIRADNVNDALDKALSMVSSALRAPESTEAQNWRRKAPRGMPTIERKGVVITEYAKPMERVLFSAQRDANPFFHFFESLWILDGRDDVAFLATFNPNMKNFSDDGKIFHAPYGYRLRRHFAHEDDVVDQLVETIELLKREPDTRRAVMCIWDPAQDLNVQSKDLPCNDMIMFSINEENKLEVEVVCRSNDVIWGAYGANAVQFSVLQEFVARAVGIEVGMLSQISRSFHFYLENETFKKLTDNRGYGGLLVDPYLWRGVDPFPLMSEGTDYKKWLAELHEFMNGGCTQPAASDCDAFWPDVAVPLHKAWFAWKNERAVPAKNERIVLAQQELVRCRAMDWRAACHEWLERRREVQ